MPVIPSLDAPQVSPPMPTGNNYQTADGATPAAFGAGVGQAIQGLANVGMQAGDMLSHHAVALQGMNNERDALNANTDATQKIADRWNQFASLNGKDAADAYPQFTKDIAQIHQDAMGALGNPEAKMMFDRAGKALIQRFTMAASTRAADENRRSQGQANQSAATSQQDTAVLFRNDPNAFATSLAVGRNNLANAAGPSGWDDETLKLKQAQFTDQTYSKAVAAMAVEDPMKALGWYKAHQDQIGGEAQAAIEQHLKPMVMANQARVVADRIIGGLPGQAASAITGEATAQGQPPARALTWAKLESNIGAAPDQPGNPHTGLFQMGPDEWKANGGDPSERGQTSAEARVGVKSMAGSMDTAGAAVGGKAEDWQGYLVHQQGQAGGPALLKADPAANVVDALTPAYRGDRAKAEAAITANGGNANGTVGDFLGMVQAKYAKAEGTVSVPSGQAQSTDIRDNAASLLAQARATPDPFGGDDPQWHDMLESHVKARIGEIEYGQAQADRGAQQTLLSAAIGIPANGAAGNVTKPTDLGTLLKDPTFSAAWSTAKPQTQQSILQVLEHNARMEEPPLTQDAMSRYYGLLGERGRDPDAFLGENLADPELVKLLPSHLLFGLMQEQKSAEMKNAAEAQKGIKLQQSLSVVKPDLLAAGIAIPTDKDKGNDRAKTYDQFVGRFSEALNNWQAVNKKPPQDSDVRGVAQSLLTQGYQTGGGWFGNDTATRLFQAPDGGKGFYVAPPSADRAAIIRDWQTVHPGQPPTETQIRNVYTQSQLRKRPAQSAALPVAQSE